MDITSSDPRSFVDPRLEALPSDAEEPRVGELLRRARLSSGRDIADAAAQLCIRESFLRALEANRFDQLPGAPYALGFLRSYAAWLGVDTTMIVARFKSEQGVPQLEKSLVFPEPLPARSVPVGAVVASSVALAALFYSIWWYMSGRDLPAPEEPPLATLSEPAPPAPPIVVESPTVAVAEHDPATTETAQFIALANGAPADGAPTDVAAPAPTGEGTPVAAADSPATAAAAAVMIRAVAPSWIQVSAPDGTILFAGLLKPGQHYTVPDRPGARLLIGNAGGLEVLVDGIAVPPLGASGAVLRNVALDPERLRRGSAVSPPLPQGKTETTTEKAMP